MGQKQSKFFGDVYEDFRRCLFHPGLIFPVCRPVFLCVSFLAYSQLFFLYFTSKLYCMWFGRNEKFCYFTRFLKFCPSRVSRVGIHALVLRLTKVEVRYFVTFQCGKKKVQFFFVLYLQLNLRSHNEELRHHLIEARKELEQNNRELSLKKQVIVHASVKILDCNQGYTEVKSDCDVNLTRPLSGVLGKSSCFWALLPTECS